MGQTATLAPLAETTYNKGERLQTQEKYFMTKKLVLSIVLIALPFLSPSLFAQTPADQQSITEPIIVNGQEVQGVSAFQNGPLSATAPPLQPTLGYNQPGSLYVPPPYYSYPYSNNSYPFSYNSFPFIVGARLGFGFGFGFRSPFFVNRPFAIGRPVAPVVGARPFVVGRPFAPVFGLRPFAIGAVRGGGGVARAGGGGGGGGRR